MPHWSRRATLAAVAGSVTALAGCPGTTTVEETPTERRRTVENYEVTRVRDADGAALFGESADAEPTTGAGTDARSGADDGSDANDGDAPDAGRTDVGGVRYLTSESAFERLAFGDGEAARRLREFAGATDFEAESVYLYARGVSACYALRLESVAVDGSDPHANFCRDRRPADVQCATEATVSVGYAIRLPFPGDDHSGLGSGLRGTCAGPERPERFETNVTVATGDEDA